LRRVGKKEAEAICRELVNGMQEESFSEAGRSLNLRCSIGATMIRGSRANPAKLLRRADTACYQAKSSGRNQFCFYKVTSKEIAEIAADGDWCQRIQTALKQDAFVLHYQPIVNIRTRETAYYEVLLRMGADDEELAFPGTFLPAAARLGLTVDIDHWVMRESLRSLAALRSVHGDTCFTLNVSGSTFDRPDFRKILETELRATGVPFDAVIIEITEQIAMRDPVAAAAQMAVLVDRGCRFAIDDFGSGYCSYSYLKNLPVAFVKIDGSFIANLAKDAVDQRIVAAIAEIAAATGCLTIAEHVKDYETLRLLDGLGVSYAQGYFLGRPSAEVKAAAVPAPLAVATRRRGPLRQRVFERSS
jgi:EAL domain-containing protein (putative c-di-GMP-specific phosphodiesterase class I)